MIAHLLRSTDEPWRFALAFSKECDLFFAAPGYEWVIGVSVSNPDAVKQAIADKYGAIHFQDQPCNAIAQFITATLSDSEGVYGVDLFDQELLDFAKQMKLWQHIGDHKPEAH